MAAELKMVYWLLDHGFQLVSAHDHSYYTIMYYHKTIRVRKIDPSEQKRDYRDRYICFISKTAQMSGDIFYPNDWVIATGKTPKESIKNAITEAYKTPDVRHKDELQSFGLTLNPVIYFLRNIFTYLNHS